MTVAWLVAMARALDDGLACRKVGCTAPYLSHLVTLAHDNLKTQTYGPS